MPHNGSCSGQAAPDDMRQLSGGYTQIYFHESVSKFALGFSCLPSGASKCTSPTSMTLFWPWQVLRGALQQTNNPHIIGK